MAELINYFYVAGVVLLLFGAAIFVHEFGHFWVALKRGLKVEEFAIGFGPIIWSKEHEGILYSIRLIPAGGFVKLPQMLTSEALEGKTGNDNDQEEEDISDSDKAEELPPVSPLSKILVAFAGPLMNVVFAFLIAGFLWFVGIPKPIDDPIVGYVGEKSREFKEGVMPGDRITEVNGEPVDAWSDVIYTVLGTTGDTVEMKLLRGDEEKNVKIPADKKNGAMAIRSVNLNRYEKLEVESIETPSLLGELQLNPGDIIQAVDNVKVYSQYHLVDLLMVNPGEEKVISVLRDGTVIKLNYKTPEIAGVEVGAVVMPEYGLLDRIKKKFGIKLEPLDLPPAAKADIQEGDIIKKMGGTRITSTAQLIDIIRAQGEQEAEMILLRGGKEIAVSIAPVNGVLGIGLDQNLGLTYNGKFRYSEKSYHPTPLSQVGDVLNKIAITFKALANRSESGVGAKDLSGPVGIFGMLAIQVNHDLRLALSFLVLLNINLAILNLLPVPVLDGGHILMSLIEWVRKEPVSAKFQEWATTAFAALLLCFFVYVTFADVRRVPRLHEIFKTDTQIESSSPSGE